MEQWVRVAGADEIRPGEGRAVHAGVHTVAVFNDGGEFLAIDDECPHQGASLALGLVHAGRVICPLHSWVFDLRSGRCPVDSHEPVATWSCRRNGDDIEVRLPAAGGAA
jgi:nitrite reductase/ring-hydroxylating ferredoxin subunit